MDNYLQNELGVGNATMRNNLIDAGFTDLEAVALMTDEQIKLACRIIRQGPGQNNQKNIPPMLENNLKRLSRAARYKYIVSRPMGDYADMTLGNITAIATWHHHFDHFDGNPSSSDVKPFSQGGLKKNWFEAIDAYLQQKAGKSGFPIFYVTRAEPIPALADDPGFMQPSIE